MLFLVRDEGSRSCNLKQETIRRYRSGVGVCHCGISYIRNLIFASEAMQGGRNCKSFQPLDQGGDGGGELSLARKHIHPGRIASVK